MYVYREEKKAQVTNTEDMPGEEEAGVEAEEMSEDMLAMLGMAGGFGSSKKN
jgi:hypothetical protein